MTYRFYTQDDYPGLPQPLDTIALIEDSIEGNCLFLTDKGTRSLTPDESRKMLHFWMHQIEAGGSA
jgi:hypothetical protein